MKKLVVLWVKGAALLGTILFFVPVAIFYVSARAGLDMIDGFVDRVDRILDALDAWAER